MMTEGAGKIAMTVRQKYQKALMLLDRGAFERGEEVLRQVVSESEGDATMLVEGLVCLGDLLQQTGRSSESRPFLERALQQKLDDELDDLLDWELDRARELLSAMVSSDDRSSAGEFFSV